MSLDPTDASLAEGCPSDETLGALIEGALSDAPRVEHHVARCARCRSLCRAGAWSARRASGASRPTASTDDKLGAGTRIGRYIVLARVGAGAMGTVYAAQDPDLDRKVALKLLRAHGADVELRARLMREAKAMARLSHPSVITVYDVGAHDGALFIAMELVIGGTLRTWLEARARDWREVLALFVRAGAGLASAHAAGLVHRDFKPDNVLVGDDGRVRITDFGLARGVHDASDWLDVRGGAARDPLDATITRTGALVGTPAYMAPEQLWGSAADARADMFGFCVALYEALYGERPFAGATILALRESTARGDVREAPRGSRVPEDVRRALLGGLCARPEERHGSMRALLDALEAAMSASAPARELRSSLPSSWTVPTLAPPEPASTASSSALVEALLRPEARRPAPRRTGARVAAAAVAIVIASGAAYEWRRAARSWAAAHEDLAPRVRELATSATSDERAVPTAPTRPEEAKAAATPAVPTATPMTPPPSTLRAARGATPRQSAQVAAPSATPSTSEPSNAGAETKADPTTTEASTSAHDAGAFGGAATYERE